MIRKTSFPELHTDGRIWITTAEGKFIGKGRIELMEKIQQFGSIRQAAAAMEMSYRQAWQLIDDINAKATTPLVVSHRGGKGGGHAAVTAEGEAIIKKFHSFNKRFQQFLLQEASKLKG